MAQSRLHNAVEELLTCAFCLSEAINPKSLECQHTFCLECLTQYIRTKDVKDKIECPTCRQWSHLPNGGLDRLQVNFFFNQLKDAAVEPNTGHTSHMSLPAGLVCSSPECEGKPAVKYCDKCEYLCSDCERDHKSVRVLKKHNLLDIEESQQLQAQQLPTCDKHPDKLIKLYCEDCKMAVCSRCFLTFHQHHKWVELASKSAEAKAGLKEVLQQVRSAIENVKATELTMKQQTAKVDEDGAKVKHEVQRELMAQVSSINDGVDQACHQTRKQLKAESDRLSVTLATLESIELCGEKLLQHGNPADYMMTVPVLVKQLHDNNPDKMTYLMDDVDLTSVKQQIQDIINHQDDLERKEAVVKKLNTEIQNLKDSMLKETQNLEDTQNELQLKETRIKNLVTENQDLRDSIQKNRQQTECDLKKQQVDGKKMMTEIDSLKQTIQQQTKTITDLKKQENTHQASAVTLKPVNPEQPQPDGGSWDVRKDTAFYGPVIVITCRFPAGIQTAAHPNPGKGYQAAELRGYLPDTTEGKDVLRRLEEAFRLRILVTVRYEELSWNGVNLYNHRFSSDLPGIKRQLDVWGIK